MRRFLSRREDPEPAPAEVAKPPVDLTGEIPIPPEEMRRLVGPTDPATFDNPEGASVFGGPERNYESVLDFGCGCGRVARQLLQQKPPPERYVGVDIHAGMIAWDNENLAPRHPGFSFKHHDVFAAGLNPGADKPLTLPLPVESGDISLAVAISVFTHLLEEQAVHYLRELRRVLRDDGIFLGTFFLFEKDGYPMMQDFQNALYINHVDPTNAVIFDRQWLQRTARECGLVISNVAAPDVRGYHWSLTFTPDRPDVVEVEIPEDTASIGIRRPPLMPEHAERIGLTEASE
jgi:SAM-dependent methyltransferase